MTNSVTMAGVKWDGGKARFDLIPAEIEQEVAKVLTVGAAKYAPDNWKKVPGGKWRYIAAMRRHISAYQRGEINDPDDGLHHMAHAICCAMFLGEADITGIPLALDEPKEVARTTISLEEVLGNTSEPFVGN